jgi:hypothetical protein
MYQYTERVDPRFLPGWMTSPIPRMQGHQLPIGWFDIEG